MEKILNQINKEVNQKIRFVSDQELYGKEEHWEIAKDAGDCEDIALRKREELVNIGFSRDRLKLVACLTETKERHIVLSYRTCEGLYYLDNRFDAVQTPASLVKKGYSIIKMEGKRPMQWIKKA